MKKILLICLCVALVAGCANINEKDLFDRSTATSAQSEAVELTEHSYNGLSFKIDSSFITQDELVFRDEENNMGYMPMIVSEPDMSSYTELLASLISPVRMDSNFGDFYFYSAMQKAEVLELQAENGEVYLYDILVLNFKDGQSIAALSTEISGEFVVCYADFYNKEHADLAIETMISIAKSFQVDKDKVPVSE